MASTPESDAVDPTLVRYLKVLVTVLSITMIVGFIIIVTLFVIRFSDISEPDLPAGIILPDGAKPAAFTQGTSWYAVVTQNDEILIYSRATHQVLKRVKIETDTD